MEGEVENCEDHYNESKFHYKVMHIEHLLHFLVLLIMRSKMIYVILLVLQVSHALEYHSQNKIKAKKTNQTGQT